LLELVSAGEDIIIAKSGKPIARLTSCGGIQNPRTKGLLKGHIEIRDDFDAPLPEDLTAVFEGDA
jgi:antitoxin (DNA-binding transcriptional repressor) of toxin-antitoxin stability system